jgi:putative transposase
MTRHIRPRVPGVPFFFTVALARRGGALLTNEIDALRMAVIRTQAERPFLIDAFVVLPDHLHAVWTLPDWDADFATRWSVIKARFSRSVPVGPHRTGHLQSGGRALWQRRFQDHHIRTPEDHAACIRHCIANPVRHGLVARPEDWPFSSIHRDIRAGRWAA